MQKGVFAMKKLLCSLAFLMALHPLVTSKPAALVKEAVSSQNSDLQKTIQNALLLLPGYTVFDNISFELNGTTVRLMGEVTQEDLREAAEQTIKELTGIKRVINEIKVLPYSTVDNQIRIAAFHAIYGDPAFQAYAAQSVRPIRIIVENGCLTLEGTVATEGDREAAYKKVLSVPGLVAVSNHLRVGS
jgi:hyperosmotically inducible protein